MTVRPHAQPPDTASWNSPVLPRMTRGEAACRRQLCRGRAPLPFSLGPHALSLSLASPRELSMASALPVRLRLRIGDAQGQLCLAAPLARFLLESLAPRLPLEHPDLDLLLEAALAAPLDELEQLLYRPLSLLPPDEKSPANLHAIGLRIHHGNGVLGLAVLRLAAAEMALVADALDRLPSEPINLEHLTFGVVIAAGAVLLPAGMLRQLRRGDILLTDDTLAADTIRVVIAGQHGVIGRKTGHAYEIISPMQGIAPMEGQQEEPAETTFDGLKVQIVFEAGRLELPLGELRKMQPGYVLELDRPAGLSVDLTVRGQPIGKAELVQVDNTLGARILRLFEHD